jgi:predicted DNA-binding protein YlxM (UPF0122 family)
LISNIIPDNIFFLERHSDNSIEVLNPCYPAYATRMLYDYHTGYDYVILVEDDLARGIIRRLLKEFSLLTNRLIHVLPCGGYANVIDLAHEVVSSNLIGMSNVIIVLDRDIEKEAQKYISNSGISNNIPLNYLPIESLEKYLKTNLIDKVDHKLFRRLNDYIFHNVSLSQIVDEYKNSGDAITDNNGKKLYNRIDNELRARNRNRNEIIEMIINYLVENKDSNINKIVEFLKKQFEV